MLEIIGPDNITEAVLPEIMLQVRGIVKDLDGLAAKVEEVSKEYKKQATNFKRRVRRYARNNSIEAPLEKRLSVVMPFDFSPSTRCEMARFNIDKFNEIEEHHQNRLMTMECEYVGRLELLEKRAKDIMKDHSELYGRLIDKTIVKKPFHQTEVYPVALLCVNCPDGHYYWPLRANFLEKQVTIIGNLQLPKKKLSQHDEETLRDVAKTECLNVYMVYHFSDIVSGEEMAEHVVLQFHAKYAKDGEALKRKRVQQLIDNALFAKGMDEHNQDIIAEGYKRK